MKRFTTVALCSLLTCLWVPFLLGIACSQTTPPEKGGPGVSRFLARDGRFDMERARRSGFEGTLNLAGCRVDFAPRTGEPIFSSIDESTTPQSDPARWRGIIGLPGLDGTVRALTVYKGDLIAGGDFTQAGAIRANCIAKWNGSSWSALGGGMTAAGGKASVTSLAVYGDDLVVGGTFSRADKTEARNIATWDGRTWSSLGGGTNGAVRALLVDGASLVVAGDFEVAGTLGVNNVARWENASWLPMGQGIGGPGRIGYLNGVTSLVAYNGHVVAGGYFLESGAPQLGYVAEWDGAVWKPLGSGVRSYVSALAVQGGSLVSGGQAGISIWDGASWTNLRAMGETEGITREIYSLTVYDGKLVAGGQGENDPDPASLGTMRPEDQQAAEKRERLRGVAVWDGSSWQTPGNGLGNKDIRGGTHRGSHVYALATYGASLIVGGEFLQAGGEEAENIAGWNGSSWRSLGSCVSGRVTALAFVRGDLFAVGGFTKVGETPALRVARWNGKSWSALGSEPDGLPMTAVAYKGDLIVGGFFLGAGGFRTGGVARWDGAGWSALGSGLDGGVVSLFEFDGGLIASGSFGRCGGVELNGIAKWDGVSWSPLGRGISRGVATVFQGNLVAGIQDGYSGEGQLLQWSGDNWLEVGPPLDNEVWSLWPRESHLIVEGEFTRAGGLPVKGRALWDGVGWKDLSVLDRSVEASRPGTKAPTAARAEGAPNDPEIRAVVERAMQGKFGDHVSLMGGRAPSRLDRCTVMSIKRSQERPLCRIQVQVEYSFRDVPQWGPNAAWQSSTETLTMDYARDEFGDWSLATP